MNKQVINDISKAVKKSGLGGSQELTPGSTPRRYEPEGGVAKHNARIHRESDYVDKHKNLPFSFSKPPKVAKSKVIQCKKCDYVTVANKNTIGMICPQCKEYVRIEEVEVNE